MAEHNLETLLFRIRDGIASTEDCLRARQLVMGDPRLPEELREVVDFHEDPQGDAVGLLAVLGADSLFGDVLREGLAVESGVESPVATIAPAAPSTLDEPNAPVTTEMVDGDWEWSLELSEAIAYWGGTADVVSEVAVTLELELQDLPLAEAVRAAAGDVEVVGSVFQELGLEESTLPLAAAVRAESGGVELADVVMRTLGGVERLPIAAALRFEAGEVEIADAVFVALGLGVKSLPVAAAIRGEAGPVDVVESVQSTLSDVRIPLAAAIRAEAGTVDLWGEIETVVADAWVSALLDHQLAPAAHRAAVLRLQNEPEAGALMTEFASLGRDLRTAVTEEAGDSGYVWGAVAAEIGVEADLVEGWDGVRFAAAVRDEAGTVDVTAAVMERTRPRRLPFAAVEVEAITPANNRRFLGQVGAALMVMVVLVVFGVLTNQPGAIDVVQTGASVAQFASADEIVVEELNYGERSNVMVMPGDDGALILWVDEGATL